MSENGLLYIPIGLSLIGWVMIRYANLSQYSERLLVVVFVGGAFYGISQYVFSDLNFSRRVGFAIPYAVAILIAVAWREGRSRPFPTKEERNLQLLRLGFVLLFAYYLIVMSVVVYTFALNTNFPFYPVYPPYLTHHMALPVFETIKLALLCGLLVSIWMWTTGRPRSFG